LTRRFDALGVRLAGEAGEVQRLRVHLANERALFGRTANQQQHDRRQYGDAQQQEQASSQT
jgi:hypothetical protein